MIAALALWVLFGGKTTSEVATDLKELRRLYQRGDYEEAKTRAEILLTSDDSLDEVRFIAADSAAQVGNVAGALTHLSLLKTENPNTNLKASLLKAELSYHKTYDLQTTEAAYRSVLDLDPDNVIALESLARLFSICGRRREAIPLLLHLVEIDHSSDLLIVAARGTGAINDPELLKKSHAAFPNHCGTFMGLAMAAEKDANFKSAIALSRQAIANDSAFAPAVVQLGQLLLADRQFDELDRWETTLSTSHHGRAETWRVRGYLAEHRGNQQLALEYFLHAARLGPELKDVQYRLSRLLQKAGDQKAASVFSNRLFSLQELETQQDRLFANGPEAIETIIETVAAFQRNGRLWEAYGWAQIARSYHPANNELSAILNELKLLTANLPLELVPSSLNPATLYSAGSYSLRSVQPANDSDMISHLNPDAEFSFRNDASVTKLKFIYINGVTGPTTYRMFEFTGGGIGVCDFDLDDYPDLYFTQGCLWETRGQASGVTDKLFRNIHGEHFQADAEAGIDESEFGQGVAVGDLNEDGFPDIFVANIGQNGLWINNGDGTFSDRRDLVSDVDDDKWTTSALIADLDGDAAADIFATNYLGGEGLFERVCSGSDGIRRACIPVHFEPLQDSLWFNDRQGTATNVSNKLDAIEPGKGLGVLAWSPGNNGKLSVFVANDTTPNTLFNFNEGKNDVLVETGFASGIAVNSAGKSEGSMGIAAGDLNSDGYSELFVTNFFHESNTLYQSIGESLFEDITSASNIAADSFHMLGFGTQFIDGNLDGSFELAVANGHVDDLVREGKPYYMPTQFFTIRDGAFSLYSREKLGDYFQQNHLGRSMAALDWNKDGRPDLAVGHLYEEYALLTNTCSVSGNFIALRFVGIHSSRDAIGVSVSYELNDRRIVRQLTAGDGYQASNQHEILLGCGSVEKIESLTVQWPSGETQTLKNISTNSRYVLREGERTLFKLP